MSTQSEDESVTVLDDAFEVFHAGIKRTLQEQSSRGAARGDLGVEYVARADGLELAISVDEGRDRVLAARYDGDATPAESAVLEQLCIHASGTTPRELIEHGLTFAVERLRDSGSKRPVDGILAPRNAGPCFQRPRLLVRALRDTYIAAKGSFVGDNDFDRPYSEAWLATRSEEKQERLKTLVQAYRDQTGLQETAMAVYEIDQYDRVVVMFDDDVEVWDKPPHLLALERWLRQETGERIEVFVEIAKDSNRIRRL
jgi:hypothetical protein